MADKKLVQGVVSSDALSAAVLEALLRIAVALESIDATLKDREMRELSKG